MENNNGISENLDELFRKHQEETQHETTPPANNGENENKRFSFNTGLIPKLGLLLAVILAVGFFSFRNIVKSPEEVYEKGMELFAAQDYLEALHCFEKAADKGNPDAAFAIAYMYYEGEGLAKDWRQAIVWFEKAAKLGDAAAANNIGCIYYEGEDGLKDYEKAAEWFLIAAEQGSAYAMGNLAECYANGEGLDRDYEQAVYWYRQAIASGDESRVEDLAKAETLLEGDKLSDRFSGQRVLASFPEDDVYIVVDGGSGGPESGQEMHIYKGDQFQTFDFPWFIRHGIEFSAKADPDRDGTDEYILVCPVSTGTGIKVCNIMIFDPRSDGTFRVVCLDDEDICSIMREKCFAGNLSEQYILIRDETEDIPKFKRLERCSDAGCGVQLLYSLNGNKISTKMSMQFIYSEQEQTYLFSNDLWEIYDDNPETACIHPDGTITADVIYNGYTLELANIQIPGSYVDPNSLI